MIVTIKLKDREDGKVDVDVEMSEPINNDNPTKACLVAGRMLAAAKAREEEDNA